jgi:hypothetical protein
MQQQFIFRYPGEVMPVLLTLPERGTIFGYEASLKFWSDDL